MAWWASPGGGYQQRVATRESTYQGELSAQERLQAEAKAVQRERDAVRGELNQANARLAELERRLAQQRAALRTSGGQSGAARQERQRLDQAQARINQTKGAMRGVRPQEQPVSDLKARSVAIQRNLDEIDHMVGTVGGRGF